MFAQKNAIYSMSNTLSVTKFELIVYGTVIFLIALWFRMRWEHRKFYDLASKLPGNPSYPLKGSTFELPVTPEKLMANIKKAAEDFNYEPVKMWIGPVLFVGVFKPEDVQIVLNSSKAIEKGIVYDIIKHLAGDGIFTAPVDKWRRHRRVIATIFNPKFLDQLFPIFNKNNKKLVESLSKHLDDPEPFDLWNYIMSCNLNNVSQAAMGFDQFDKDKIPVFVSTLKKLTGFGQLLVKPWLYLQPIFAIFAHVTGWYNDKDVIDNITKEIIQKKKKEFNSRKSEKIVVKNEDDIDENLKERRTKVFLDKLLKLNDEGADFTDQDIRDEVITMTVAGSDTSAIAECFSMLLLAIFQDIQDKVYEEIYSILGDSDRAVGPEDIPKFKYLEQVIKESLRHFSPGAIYSRKTDDNIKLRNYELPAGCNVFVTPFVTHKIPELYPNPEEFNPENFSVENESKRNKFSFIAFSGGLRGCLGTKYAMLSMKLMLVEILRNYRLYTKVKFSDIELQLDMLAKSKNGYKIMVKPRKPLKS